MPSTTSAEALMELAERCEKAEGPDRALSDLIYDGALFQDEADALNGAHPHYTASIDAALTLVPETWCIASLEWWPMTSIKAGITLREVKSFGGEWPSTGYDETCGAARSRGETPALALCAASLRARASAQQP